MRAFIGKVSAVANLRDLITQLKVKLESVNNLHVVSVQSPALLDLKTFIEEVMRLGVREYQKNPDSFLMWTGDPKTGIKGSETFDHDRFYFASQAVCPVCTPIENLDDYRQDVLDIDKYRCSKHGKKVEREVTLKDFLEGK